MTKKRLDIDWSKCDTEDIKPALKRYANYLKGRGFRESTIELYVRCLKSYLKFVQTDLPTEEDSIKFNEYLLEKNLSRSAINNSSFAVINYHKMLGKSINIPIMKRDDEIPYYFNEDDVLRILSVCHNLKHLAMLQTLFYGCLRASELCNLDDRDLDLKNLTIRVREGKGGRDGIVFISNECAATLKRYLQIRPPLEVDGLYPLFYTDFGGRWGRTAVHRMFVTYKKKAGIEKEGGVHVFGRHSPATIMVAKGCDIRIIKELLRHKDIRTTLRYAHVANETKRKMYEEYLVL